MSVIDEARLSNAVNWSAVVVEWFKRIGLNCLDPQWLFAFRNEKQDLKLPKRKLGMSFRNLYGFRLNWDAISKFYGGIGFCNVYVADRLENFCSLGR